MIYVLHEGAVSFTGNKIVKIAAISPLLFLSFFTSLSFETSVNAGFRAILYSHAAPSKSLIFLLLFHPVYAFFIL